MYLIEFEVQYIRDNIYINRKKLKLFLDKCNTLCNNINPIYCPNCRNLIESELSLNYKFSNYILKDKNSNKSYEVIRNSIKNDYIRMNYCNNNYDNSIYNYYSFNEYPENFNHQNFNYQCNDQNDYNLEYNYQFYNQQYYDQQCYNNLNKESNYYFDDETKTISDLTFDEKNEKKYDDNISIDENNEDISNKYKVLKDEVNEETVLKDEVNEETVLKDEVNEETVLKDEVNEETVLKDEINEETVLKDEVNEETVLKEVKLSKKEKNRLKKERKKERKREENEKNIKKHIDEEIFLKESIELNRNEILNKLNQLNIENYDIIKSYSYEELLEIYNYPIVYDMKKKYLLEFCKSKKTFDLDDIFEDDFDILEKYYKKKNENYNTVNNIRTYISKSEFNKYFFTSIYLKIKTNFQLTIFIKLKNGKILAQPHVSEKERRFFDLILEKDNSINKYFSDYIIMNVIDPFKNEKEKKYGNKYDKYIENLDNKKKITTQESLLFSYHKMLENEGTFCIGKEGILKIKKNNEIEKVYN